MKKYTIEIDENKDDGFFLRFYIGYQNISNDNEIIEYFNLSKEYYNNILLNIMNGKVLGESIFFSNKNDARIAKNWFIKKMDYLLILKKLGGK